MGLQPSECREGVLLIRSGAFHKGTRDGLRFLVFLTHCETAAKGNAGPGLDHACSLVLDLIT